MGTGILPNFIQDHHHFRLMARRKKNRTHLKGGVPVEGSSSANTSNAPKSVVVKHGQVGPALSQLVRDLRKVMEPNTASKLRVRLTHFISSLIPEDKPSACRRGNVTR